MAEITQEIEEILQLNSQARDSFTAAEIISAQKTEKMNELQTRIKGGETTGDRIKDFVISRYGLLSDEIEEVYRNIDTKINQHNGELILMIAKGEQFHGCVGFGYEPRNSEYTLDVHFYLGVLSSNGLVLNCSDASCALPTEEHLTCWGLHDDKLESKKGNISGGILNDFWYFLNKPLECRNPYNRGENPMHLELKIGDEEVMDWFQSQGKHHEAYLAKAAAHLGHGLILPNP